MFGFEVMIENTRTEIKIVKWYVVEGVDAIEEYGQKLLPTTVKFTFSGERLSEMGDITMMFINARTFLKDGSVSQKKWKIVTKWSLHYDRDWPQWLKDLRQRAWDDFKADRYALVTAK